MHNPVFFLLCWSVLQPFKAQCKVFLYLNPVCSCFFIHVTFMSLVWYYITFRHFPVSQLIVCSDFDLFLYIFGHKFPNPPIILLLFIFQHIPSPCLAQLALRVAVVQRQGDQPPIRRSQAWFPLCLPSCQSVHGQGKTNPFHNFLWDLICTTDRATV